MYHNPLGNNVVQDHILHCSSFSHSFSYTSGLVLTTTPQKSPQNSPASLVLLHSTTSSGRLQHAPNSSGSEGLDLPPNADRGAGEHVPGGWKGAGFHNPVESFAYSAFNIIYLTFHTHEYSGSISIQAKNFGHKETEELAVVGGTGSFSFARGLAVFAETNRQTPNLDATYLIKLHLKFPNRSQTIPG
ncbi:UNVERIFIED_CONTAM: hypothetical protein Sangu_3085100 [Sesamum angustifolium]|uniref:Dirigent protein n=1 Tax=Sesamum angustifolium TaxID=2727405 RepID=A0AAW2K909_9LAMI